MSRSLKKVFLVLLLFFLTTTSVNAAENNKFGIHLAVPDTGQLEKAAELVNANGGDWGYVTLVIQENDRDHDKWQNIFNKLRQLHLIPIIRLATEPQGPVWKRPTKEDADQWVEFLNGLNWVVKDRYVILFNETNHGQEWGGSVDPVNYAQVAQEFAQKLKAKNKDFFIMLAGLDASAPASSPDYADEAEYLPTVVNTIGSDTFNKLFSGLSSHSYPNPAFAGSPTASGRTTVRTYEWELGLLQNLGVKELPVFITETGWDADHISRQNVANDFYSAFNNVWLPDDRVKAVTPFVLDYQGQPFLGFSWKKLGSDDFYDQYYTVQNMPKIPGNPEIIQKGSITFDLPKSMVVTSNYHYKVTLKNIGQAIWDENSHYRLALENYDSTYYFADMGSIEPFQSSDVDFYFKIGTHPGSKHSKIALFKDDQKILESAPWNYEVVPFPELNFRVSLYPRLKQKGDDFTLLIYNKHEQVIFKKSNVTVEHGEGAVGGIRNITLDNKYRVVILKPYYLPRQTFLTFKRGSNKVVFERMLPLDFNKDGKFDFSDIWTFITHPSLISLLSP